MILKWTYINSVLLIGIISLNSCDKIGARKISGTYECKVDYFYWDATGTQIDSTYLKDVIVDHKKENIIMGSYEIPFDSIADEDRYIVNGNPHSLFIIQFVNDSLYMETRSGGLGGGTIINYSGKKKN